MNLKAIATALVVLLSLFARCNPFGGPPRQSVYLSDEVMVQGRTTDSSDNLYIYGNFGGTFDFKPDTASETKSSILDNDRVLAKYDKNNDLQWIYTWEGNNNRSQINDTSDYVIFMISDPSGGIIYTGNFIGRRDLDPTDGVEVRTSALNKPPKDAGNVNYSNYPDFSYFNPFLTKIGSDGKFKWTNAWGNAQHIDVKKILLQSTGEILVYGSYHGKVDFDTGDGELISEAYPPSERENGEQYPQNYEDTYILRFAPDGKFKNVMTWGDDKGTFMGAQLIVTETDDIFIVGTTSEILDVDPGPGEVLINPATPDAGASAASDEPGGGYSGMRGPEVLFVVKFAPDGKFEWVSTWAPPYSAHAWGLITDSNGNVYVGGTIQHPPTKRAKTSRPPAIMDCQMAFILKLDSNGKYQWDKMWGGGRKGEGAYVYGLEIDPNGDLLVNGSYNTTVDFDPGEGKDVIEVTSQVRRNQLLFTSKFDTNGNYLGVEIKESDYNISELRISGKMTKEFLDELRK